MTQEQEKCVHGVAGCIHKAVEHDEDACFNGIWRHTRVCQECGFTQEAITYSTKTNEQGLYVAPKFPPKKCPKCGTEKGLI